LSDSHPGVRRAAVSIAREVTVEGPSLINLINDDDAKVRLELASTLGSYKDTSSAKALARLLLQNESEPYIVAAVMSSLNANNVRQVFDEMIHAVPGQLAKNSFTLMSQAMALGDLTVVSHVTEVVFDDSRWDSLPDRYRARTRVLDEMAAHEHSIARLSATARRRVSAAIDQARSIVSDESIDAEVRALAVGMLGRDPDDSGSDQKLLDAMLSPQSPHVVQRAVVQRITSRSESESADRLLRGWSGHSPELRQLIVAEIAKRPAWTEKLRMKLEAREIRPSELTLSRRQQLLNQHNHSEPWQRALANSVSTDRQDVIRTFQPALQLTGNAGAGSQLFRKKCLSCHKVGKDGKEVGPNLAAITNKSSEAIFQSILDPNAAVDPKYLRYSLLSLDGRVMQGMLGPETSSSITLIDVEGKEHKVLRRDIDTLRSSDQSLMPVGLEEEINPQDLANLISYVQSIQP